MTHVTPAPIPAISPRDESGHQFVLYSDSCSGQPGAVNEARHAQVTAVIRRLEPQPEFIAFPGDAVMNGDDAEQWRHWIDDEMSWLNPADCPLYQSTSNHSTFSEDSVRRYRDVWRHLPQNGPAGQEGLAYYVRDGNLLYVSLHQPEPTAGAAMQSAVSPDEAAWLRQVLAEHADASYVLVAGHYPVFPVNGYSQAPTWCFTPDAGRELWEILRLHGVLAYLCSHVLAFDVQVHDGILQITSGGAGTCYGPGGQMPGPVEYLHAAQIAVDRRGLRLRTLDVRGRCREELQWPPPSAANPWTRSGEVRTQQQDTDSVLMLAVAESAGVDELAAGGMRPEPFGARIPWMASPDRGFALDIDVALGRFVLELELAGHGRQQWVGPQVDFTRPVSVELAFHPGMGPGGLMYRCVPGAPWTSMRSSSASGLESFTWPALIATCSPLLAMRHTRTDAFDKETPTRRMKESM
jgi:hypothetical protein